MKWLLIFLSVVLGGSIAHADDHAAPQEVESSALQLANNVDAVLYQADEALRRAISLLSDPRGMTEVILHGTLKRYAEDSPSVRAILFVDSKGILRVDSTAYPAVRLDLSDRQYFEAVYSEEEDNLYVGGQVVGTQSGVPFIPIARKVRNANGFVAGVVIAVITPEALLAQAPSCTYCFLSVFTDKGELMVSVPASIRLPDDFFGSLGVSDSQTGSASTMLTAYPARTVWRKSVSYPIIAASSYVTTR